MSSAVAMTGLGAVCALGIGTEALWAALETGRDGIRSIDRYSTEGFTTHLGALVPGFAHRKTESALCTEWAIAAAREALAEAGDCDISPERVALIVGTNLASYKKHIHTLAEDIGDPLGIRGPRITLSTACSSSTNALGLGRDWLAAGFVDRVLAGGTDMLTPEIFAGFDALGLLSSQKCAPFSEPTGTTLGEGAGFVVLERESFARNRGAAYSAVLCGYGLSSDAHHATTPDPTGAGVARGLAAALLDAGISPADIDYINAHGTGTSTNDPAEWRAIQSVFGARAAHLPVSSTKGHFGHAQGTAGVLELIATLLSMRRGMIPPTLHFTKARPRGPVDPVAQDKPRPVVVRHALNTNSAFSGANAAVVVRASSVDAGHAMSPPARRIALLGVGAVGAHGRTLDEFDRALAEGRRLGSRVVDFNIEDIIPTADPRGFNPTCRFLTAAAAMALSSAGIVLRGAARDRAGIFVGALRVSPESGLQFDASVDERGLARLSTTAFTKMVLNAAAGACSKELMLKGPTTSLTTGQGSGLSALVYAAQFLSMRRDVDVLLAGAVDEFSPLDKDDSLAEGAACLALGPADANSRVLLEGWGLAGPGQVERAVESACVMAGVRPNELERFSSVRSIWGTLLAAGPLFTCMAAFRSLSRGDMSRVLVVDGSGVSVSTAVVLAVANPGENDRGS